MRLIDSDAYAAEMRKKQDNCRVWKDSLDKGTELYARAEQSLVTFIEAALTLKNQPTIDAIPVKWLRQKAEENSHYAEPYFAFAYVLHEWQQTKSIEELQAESEMRDWKAEQEDR